MADLEVVMAPLAVPEFVISADDRTGALEVAGMSADAIGETVTVTVGHFGEGRIVVADLGTRHLDPAEAARAVQVTSPSSSPGPCRAHKIDSLLRGNWAFELVALASSFDRVLIVAAFPAMGRTCVDGIVRAATGVGGDARHANRSPRPRDHLVAAGAPGVTELTDVAAVRRWLANGSPFGVCDASSNDDLAGIAQVWSAAPTVLFAGTSAAIAAAVAAHAHAGRRKPQPTVAPALVSRFVPEVVVVCGSLHPTARAQIRLLDAASVSVLATPMPLQLPVSPSDAERSARELAVAVRDRLVGGGVGTLVVIGGDTAAAVLGDETMRVGGVVGVGMPWMRLASGRGPLVITRAGSFGDEGSLAAMIAARMDP